MLGVAIGFSGDFLHDAVQETYFQPKQNAVTIINQFYMQNGNWDIEWHGNRNGTGNSSISPEGNGCFGWQQLRMQSSLDWDVIPIMPFSHSESPIHELQACR